MDELSVFCSELKRVVGDSSELSIEKARKIVQSLNEFLYTRYPDIGSTYVLDATYDYVSDFHKYWESHYKDILDVRIDDENCEKVADALHRVYLDTNGHAFFHVWDTCGLSPEDGVAVWAPGEFRRGFVQARGERDGGNGLPDSPYRKVRQLERSPGGLQPGAFRRR